MTDERLLYIKAVVAGQIPVSMIYDSEIEYLLEETMDIMLDKVAENGGDSFIPFVGSELFH